MENGSFYAIVGSWINESDVIDSDKLRELIVDEFDLPEDICFRHEPQMNIGLVNLNKMNERVISYLKKLGIESVRELTDEQVVSYYLDESKNTEFMLYAENAFENFEREKVIASMRKSMDENVPFYCGYITNESCDGKYKPKEWGWILKP